MTKTTVQSSTVKVRWDFGDTDLEDEEYSKALTTSGLPEIVVLPKHILEEYRSESREPGLVILGSEVITDWLSDEYGFTHHGWHWVREA
jgi:hypothetical protein